MVKKKERRKLNRTKKKQEVERPNPREDWKALVFGTLFLVGILLLEKVIL